MVALFFCPITSLLIRHWLTRKWGYSNLHLRRVEFKTKKLRLNTKQKKNYVYLTGDEKVFMIWILKEFFLTPPPTEETKFIRYIYL